MVTISLCMIVRDEEAVLDRCLASVKDLVDEIIIVDTGSVDGTKAIAAQYTDQIFSFQWIDDFSAARNYSFAKATMDYCLWLDADDMLEESERLRFQQLKQEMTNETDIVMMAYHTAFNEHGAPCFCFYRERLIRNHQGYCWLGAVHEYIIPTGKILYSDVAISHKKQGVRVSDRNLRIYEKMISDGKELDARACYYYGRELYDHQHYEQAIGIFHQFLARSDGWRENKIEACNLMARCYRKIGDRQAALQALLKSLAYDRPRAEACCEIGGYFLEELQYEAAIFWFETALQCKIEYTQGFIVTEYYDYIPLLQLCVCYDRLGQYDKAKAYNDQAGAIKENSPVVLSNRRYFEQRKNEQQLER